MWGGSAQGQTQAVWVGSWLNPSLMQAVGRSGHLKPEPNNVYFAPSLNQKLNSKGDPMEYSGKRGRVRGQTQTHSTSSD